MLFFVRRVFLPCQQRTDSSYFVVFTHNCSLSMWKVHWKTCHCSGVENFLPDLCPFRFSDKIQLLPLISPLKSLQGVVVVGRNRRFVVHVLAFYCC